MAVDIDPRPVLKIGIDFGTAYSSVAYIVIKHDEACSSIEQGTFDTSLIRSVDFSNSNSQIRTELVLQRRTQRWIWGDDVTKYIATRQAAESDKFSLIKLGLDDSQETLQIREALQARAANLPQDLPEHSRITHTDDLICIYLRLLWAEAREKIGNAYRRSHKDIFSLVRVETVLCVPAIWKFATCHRMEIIARDAGLPNVELVPEPEAAAMWIKYDEPRQLGCLKEHLSGIDKPFMVLDVGCGTADIVTYIPNGPSLRQGVRSTGGLYGASKLEYYFGEFFHGRIRQYKTPLIDHWMRTAAFKIHELANATSRPNDKETDDGTRLTEVRERAESHFVEHAKKGFEQAKLGFDYSKGEKDGMFRVELPGNAYRKSCAGIEEGFCTYGRSLIANHVFWRLIDPLIYLINRHKKEFDDTYGAQGLCLQHLYFIGGASGNKHIQKLLQETFPQMSTPHENSATLISKGALVRSIQRHAIKERVLSASIGCARDEEYDKRLHPEPQNEAVHHGKKIVLDPCDNVPSVKNRIHWLFRVNQTLLLNDSTFMQGWDAQPTDGEVTIRQYIYTSASETRNHLPVSDPQNDITELGHVDIVLSEKDREHFHKMYSTDGTESWHKFDYRLKITYRQTSLLYEYLIPRRGVAVSETDWDDAICRSSALDPNALFDQTKQRATLATSHIVATAPSKLEQPNTDPRPQRAKKRALKRVNHSAPQPVNAQRTKQPRRVRQRNTGALDLMNVSKSRSHQKSKPKELSNKPNSSKQKNATNVHMSRPRTKGIAPEATMLVKEIDRRLQEDDEENERGEQADIFDSGSTIRWNI